MIMIIKSRAYKKTSLPWENCQSQLDTDLNHKKKTKSKELKTIVKIYGHL